MLAAQSAVEFCSPARRRDGLLAARNWISPGLPEFQSQQGLEYLILVLARVWLSERGEKNESL